MSDKRACPSCGITLDDIQAAIQRPLRVYGPIPRRDPVSPIALVRSNKATGKLDVVIVEQKTSHADAVDFRAFDLEENALLWIEEMLGANEIMWQPS